MASLLLVMLLVAFSAMCHGQPLGDWDQYRLIWQDEFDYLDGSKWQHEVTATGGYVIY